MNPKNKLYLPTLAAACVLLTSCSFGNIQIEKNVNSQDSQETPIDLPLSPQTAEIGEAFYAENIAAKDSGVINITIVEAKAYPTLADAGLTLEDTIPYFLGEGVHYDSGSSDLRDYYDIVLLKVKVENVNAVSNAGIKDPEKYGMYDFALGYGSCGATFYYDRYDEYNDLIFHLEQGQSVEIITGHLVDLRETALSDVIFETSATPGRGTVVDLHLE